MKHLSITSEWICLSPCLLYSVCGSVNLCIGVHVGGKETVLYNNRVCVMNACVNNSIACDLCMPVAL